MVVYERDTSRRGYFDMWDTTRSQVYGGVSAERAGSTRAVIATRGQIRTYGGKPAFTQFGSSNGGQTAQGSVPYLPSRQDGWDRWSGNPNSQWRTEVSAAAIEKAWPAVGDFVWVTILARDAAASWVGVAPSGSTARASTRCTRR